MTREEALKHLENQIDYFTYELKKSIVNSAITGQQSSNVWDKFKGFMQNLYHGKDNPKNPNYTRNVLGHGLGRQANENKHIPLKNYRFFKEWHETVECSLSLINEDYKTPELPSHIKNTQLNKIIDDWSVKFKRAILSTIGLVLGTEVPTGVLKDLPVSSGKFGASVGDGQFGGNKDNTVSTGAGSVPAGAGAGAGDPAGDPAGAGGVPPVPPVPPAGSGGVPPVVPVDPNTAGSGGVPPVVPAGNLQGSIDTKDLEEAFEKYNNWKFKIKMKASGGGGMPILNQQLLIKGERIVITGGLPYVLKFGSPIIDLIYHSDEERYKNLVKLGRIETRKDQFGEITDEQKKQIIKKSAEDKVDNGQYTKEIKNTIKDIIEKIDGKTLAETIDELTPFFKNKTTKNTATEDDKTEDDQTENATTLTSEEFLEKTLNPQDEKDTKLIYKDNLKAKLCLTKIFDSDGEKTIFINKITDYINVNIDAKNMKLKIELQTGLKQLNSSGIDEFLETIIKTMQIIFVYKLINKIKSPEGIEEEELNKISKILKELNEDSLNHIVELSSNAIKELHPESDRNNGSSTQLWRDIKHHKNHELDDIEKYFSELIKNGKYKNLLDRINVIIKKAKDLMNNDHNDYDSGNHVGEWEMR